MTLVLLAGMMCDGRLFDHMPPHICLPITDHDTVEAIAADVLNNAPATFALGGLSMGGIIAMEVIRQAPERVTRLALMDTNCEAESDKIKALREPQIDKAVSGHLKSVMRDEMKPNYLCDGPNRAAVLDLCMDMALTLGPDVFVRQSRALQTRPDQKTTLSTWQKPTLILTGEHDRLCPLHRHTLMADLIPNATLEVIKNAGHLPSLEQPKATRAAMERWLK
ncbi:alpha/beta hydrolase [Octadecabacter sp. G9-8]|uniref:Alpha/beta hydrolase n=1 Tax=Octadecabacter dasysiphoniae TaxID=2909341 RepID=A0ABS9D0G5_9RHOB|nr:alpha/beta hydrolase [Octadecabacter dasysiphoniae]MCF2871891.1 alpha/beta hydrolase [Octadecabacter dasysiphoniae]